MGVDTTPADAGKGSAASTASYQPQRVGATAKHNSNAVALLWEWPEGRFAGMRVRGSQHVRAMQTDLAADTSTAAPGSGRLERMLARLLSRPAYALLLLALVQVVVWTLAPALTHTAPPLDVVESYLWGREWVIGTFKHPGMPGWVLEISRELTGAVGWPAYLASQLFIAATFLCVFMLGREMMDTRRALAGVLLLTGVFYFAWPSIEFNHNVAQMPFWAAIAWILWRVRSRPEAIWWVLLGFLAADVLYAKLSSGLLIVVAGVWLLYDPSLRRQLRTPRPWLGLLTFVVLIAPLLLWLLREHFRPLLYGMERSAHSGEGALQFLGAQLLAAAGLVALAFATGLLPTSSASTAAPRGASADPEAVRFLAFMTLAPVLITVLAALLAGSGLKSMWGAPMLGLSGLLLIALQSHRLTSEMLLGLARGALLLLIVLPIGYGLDTLYEARLTGRPKRQNWPQAAISRRLSADWQQATQAPLQIVAGERWVAGIAALEPGAMPSILTDGDLTLSPWITPERLSRSGALLVWEAASDHDPVPTDLAALAPKAQARFERFDWPAFSNAAPLLIGYAILPPAGR